MREDWTKIDILQHVRHDWLNRIQLIQGNLALGKPERAKRVMEEIVIDMQQEAKLTNLGLPETAFLLIAHNWSGYCYTVEYEIAGTFPALAGDDRVVSGWLRRFFRLLDEHADPIHDNRLSVLIDGESGSARFVFYFDGILEDIGSLKKRLEEYPAPERVRIEQETNNETMIEVLF